MDLNEVRRIMNQRVKVFGLDKSDIDYTLMFWTMTFLGANFISGFLFGGEGGIIVLLSLVMIFPVALFVKVIKSGKNKGHLEYLFYKMTNLKEGVKNNKIFIYNLEEKNFTFKTMFYITKKD